MPLNPTEIGLRRLTAEVNEALANLSQSVVVLMAAFEDQNKRIEALEAAKAAPESSESPPRET